MRRLIFVALLALTVGCAGRSAAPPGATDSAASGGRVRLYTTVTQDTVDAVVAGFNGDNPSIDVEVFRAPTGELTARIAAEQREGGVNADVLWLSDPLSMEQYEAEGLFAPPPDDAVAAVGPRFASDGYVGTRILNMVVVHHDDVAAPQSWHDLVAHDAAAPVAIPNPAFAGSALGALGYFARNPEYGLEFYEQLKAGGAVQVQAPDEVTTGVAEGRFAAGMTLDNSARTAEEKGSPVALAAPEPGAIAIVSPIGVLAEAQNLEAAAAFVSYTVSKSGQEAVAATGWQPVRDDVSWDDNLPQVFPDWAAIAADQDRLLEEYGAIFGG